MSSFSDWRGDASVSQLSSRTSALQSSAVRGLNHLNSSLGTKTLPSVSVPHTSASQNASEWRHNPYEGDAAQRAANEYTYPDHARWLNQRLSLLQIPNPHPGPINFDFPSVEDRVRVVNTLLNLLRTRQRSKKQLDENNTTIAKLQTMVRDAATKAKRWQEEAMQHKKAFAQLALNEKATQSKTQTSSQKMEKRIRELEKENESWKFRDRQVQHELRKRDKAFSECQMRLKERLATKEKNSRVTLGMNCINAGRVAFSHMDADDSRQLELLQSQLEKYEKRMNDVISENSKLRQSYMRLSVEVKEALQEKQRYDQQKRKQGRYEMPFDMVQDEIEQDLLQDLERIREALDATDAGELAQCNPELDRAALIQKIKQQNGIIGQQEDLLNEQANRKRSEGDDKALGEMKRRMREREEDVQMEKSLLEEKVARLESERAEMKTQRRDKSKKEQELTIGLRQREEAVRQLQDAAKADRRRLEEQQRGLQGERRQLDQERDEGRRRMQSEREEERRHLREEQEAERRRQEEARAAAIPDKSYSDVGTSPLKAGPLRPASPRIDLTHTRKTLAQIESSMDELDNLLNDFDIEIPSTLPSRYGSTVASPHAGTAQAASPKPSTRPADQSMSTLDQDLAELDNLATSF